MRSLTPRQMEELQSAQTRWLEWIYSTESADRKQTEEGVRQTYAAAGMNQPEIFLWCDDLLEAVLVLEQLSEIRETNWKLPPESLRRRVEVQRKVLHQLGLSTWDQVVQAAGEEQRPNRYETRQRQGLSFRMAVPRKDVLQAGLPIAQQDEPCDCEEIEKAAAVIGRKAIRC